VGLAKKRRQNTKREQKHQPRRSPCERGGEDQRGDDLLEEPAHLLDHREAVGGLDAGAL